MLKRGCIGGALDVAYVFIANHGERRTGVTKPVEVAETRRTESKQPQQHTCSL